MNYEESIDINIIKEYFKNDKEMCKYCLRLYLLLKPHYVKSKEKVSFSIDRFKNSMGMNDIDNEYLFKVCNNLRQAVDIGRFIYAAIPRAKDNEIYKIIFFFNPTWNSVSKYYIFLHENFKSYFEM